MFCFCFFFPLPQQVFCSWRQVVEAVTWQQLQPLFVCIIGHNTPPLSSSSLISTLTSTSPKQYLAIQVIYSRFYSLPDTICWRRHTLPALSHCCCCINTLFCPCNMVKTRTNTKLNDFPDHKMKQKKKYKSSLQLWLWKKEPLRYIAYCQT